MQHFTKARENMCTVATEHEQTNEVALEDLLVTLQSSPQNEQLQDGKGKVDKGADGQKSDEDTMWDAIKADNFAFATSGSAGNPMGGRWARSLRRDPELAATYKAIKPKGVLAQVNFRRDWAKGQYNTYSATKTFSETLTTESEKK